MFMHDLCSMANTKENKPGKDWVTCLLLRITELFLGPTGFNGWQHFSPMTTLAPLCPRCPPSHTATFLCKRMRWAKSTDIDRWEAEQATAHTSSVIVYCGSGSRMSCVFEMFWNGFFFFFLEVSGQENKHAYVQVAVERKQRPVLIQACENIPSRSRFSGRRDCWVWK